ncbi:MAG: type II secretion system F family protein [Deltaproteobacteria bacterium]
MAQKTVLRSSFNASTLVTLVLGLGVAWICTGRLTFGALSFVLVPWVFRGVIRYKEMRFKRELESSAVSFFTALLGLIQSGLGLSSALFFLVQSQRTPFSETLKKHLQNYEEGRGLAVILARFRQRVELPLVGQYLAILEMAYCHGLELVPLLERMIPVLEMEKTAQNKISELRNQMLTQCLLAFLIPWVLAGVLWVFNPEVYHTMAQQRGTLGVWLFSFLMEIVGVGVLWRITRFS